MENKIATWASVAFGAIADRVPIFGSDPLGVCKFFERVYKSPGIMRQGYVVAYHPQTHSAAVKVVGDQGTWTCIFVDEMLSYSYGFSETNPPREGELVMVCESEPDSQFGFIVGRIPYKLNFAGGSGDSFNDPDGYMRRLFTMNEKTGAKELTVYSTPFSNPSDDTTHICTNFRATDVYPGEFAKINQHNCGIKGGLFSTTLLGGGASLRMSALTNGARLTCDSYKRISLLGNMNEFHNGRYLSSERDVAIYQEERLGGKNVEEKVWTEDSKAPVSGENQTIRPRIKDLSGYFGNLSSKFCLRPDPAEGGIRVQGSGAPKEAGVSRETIDPSGQYRLSAAGMIVLERTGRIPVPVRKCYPTDKDHDIKSTPEALTPFQHNETDPCYRQLELFDRQAYDLKTQYARVDGLGTDEPDYTVPQEEEVKPLEDMYDPQFTGSETVKLKKFDERRAGVYIGEDGSIILRDAWGSEIVMLAGNVTISCAGNVMMLPGKTQLTIAGDDIVQKAQNSVDIHASEHDVRLSAAKNMEIVGGGDEQSHSGGVIIESRGSGAMPWDGKDAGETASLSGITLKTNKQAVVVDGQHLVMRSRQSTRIVSGDKDVDGEVGIGAKFVRLRAKTNALISTGDGGNVIVGSSSVTVSGKSVALAGEKSAGVFRKSEYAVPVMWYDTGSAIAEEADSVCSKATEDLADESEASMVWDAKALEKMIFGFRTSAECATDRPWSIGTSGSAWRMYEPAWVQVNDIYNTLKGISKRRYQEPAEWTNGKPFPGEEAEDSAEYVQLAKLHPENLAPGGFNKSRKGVVDKSEVDTDKFKGGYWIRSNE